jgi:hypothetical protein
LTPSQLHSAAIDGIARKPSPWLRKAIADIEALDGTPRVLRNAGAIVRAAFEGRISNLLIRESAEYSGRFDETTLDVDHRAGGEDLLNFAALQTVAHGGRAFAVGATAMPAFRDSAALLRY